MINVLADASLPNLSLLLDLGFKLKLYDSEKSLCANLNDCEILICRSTLKVTSQLLASSAIKFIASASSGTDHIDKDFLKKMQIKLIDAKGSNARAVADYVVAVLAALKNSKILGNKAGIIGLGMVGMQVKARLQTLGFEILCYDPLKAQYDGTVKYCALFDLIDCDLLCIHANLHASLPYSSRNLLSGDFLSKLKPGVVIINAARGGIVNEAALLETDNLIQYCTDVYDFEPHINAKLLDFATICTSHIAGHSIEAKHGVMLQIIEQLREYYNLAQRPLAKFVSNCVILPKLRAALSWQDQVLALYDPRVDTQVLKAAIDKSAAFLSLRASHQTRHDFSCYDAGSCDAQTRDLLGS